MKQLNIEIMSGGRLCCLRSSEGDLALPDLLLPWLERVTEPGDHILIKPHDERAQLQRIAAAKKRKAAR